jgi:hypothetical protein
VRDIIVQYNIKAKLRKGSPWNRNSEIKYNRHERSNSHQRIERNDHSHVQEANGAHDVHRFSTTTAPWKYQLVKSIPAATFSKYSGRHRIQ